MKKQQLRKRLLAKRDQLTKQEIADKSERILKQLLPYLHDAKCVAVYKSIASEVDTAGIIRYLLEHGKKVAVPVCESAGIMSFYAVEEHTVFVRNAMKIEEPQDADIVASVDIDLVLVPMVGFCGHARLGYGGGYYDRFLESSKAYKIGLAFACQQAMFVKEPHDINMDLIIQENQTI